MAHVTALLKSVPATPAEWVLVLALALAPGIAAADFSGKAAGGVALASGNTDTKTANLKAETQWKIDPWVFQAGGTEIYASDSTGTTGQRWEMTGQSQYHFVPTTYWFNSGRYENDRFSGFRYQAILATGVGHDWYARDTLKLSSEVGVGYKFFATRDNFDAGGTLTQKGSSDHEPVFQFSTNYEQTLTSTTKILDKFLVEAASDNTFMQNDLSLQVKINTVLALALGYSVRRNSNPPSGFVKTDTLTTANLVYEFK